MMKKSLTARFLSLILALIQSVSLCVPAFAAGGFSDVPASHWAYNDIMTCAEAGIVKGYEDGSFRPGEEVTAIQFIVMLTRAFYSDKVKAVEVPAGSKWYYANAKVASDVGVSKNLAAVDKNAMNRYNMAMVLRNTMIDFNKQPTSDQMRNAQSQIKGWSDIAAAYTTYTAAVSSCCAAGILPCMPDGTFSGVQNVTRAQACAVIVRMMNFIGDSALTTPEQSTQP